MLEVEGGTAAALAWFTSLEEEKTGERRRRILAHFDHFSFDPSFWVLGTPQVHYLVDCLMNVRIDIAVNYTV